MKTMTSVTPEPGWLDPKGQLETVKLVEWSYPSSPNAERFHRPNGCWVVEFERGGKGPVAVAAFDSEVKAIEWANEYEAIRWHPLQVARRNTSIR